MGRLHDLLARRLLQQAQEGRASSIEVTIALLTLQGMPLYRLMEGLRDGWEIDEPLVEGLLAETPPLEAARLLWERVGFHMRPGRLVSACEEVLRRSNDLRVVRQIGGALHSYVCSRGLEAPVSDSMIDRLLRADDKHARVVGLKLLFACRCDFDRRNLEIERSLKSSCETDVVNALFVSGRLGVKFETWANEAAAWIPSEVVRRALEALDSHDDEYMRDAEKWNFGEYIRDAARQRLEEYFVDGDECG